MNNNKKQNKIGTLLSVVLPVIIFGQFFLVQMFSENMFTNNTETILSLGFIEKLKTVVLLGDLSVIFAVVTAVIYIIFIFITLSKTVRNYKKENPEDRDALSVFRLLLVLLSGKIRNYLNTENVAKYNVRTKLLAYSLALFITIPLLALFCVFTLQQVPFSNLSPINQMIENYKNNNFVESEIYIVEDSDLSIAKLLNNEMYLNSNMKYINVVAVDSQTNETIKLALPIESNFNSKGNIMSTDINYYLEMYNNNEEVAKQQLEDAIEFNKDRPKTLYRVFYVEGLNVVAGIEQVN